MDSQAVFIKFCPCPNAIESSKNHLSRLVLLSMVVCLYDDLQKIVLICTQCLMPINPKEVCVLIAQVMM